ncbi:MAG: DNA repair protein RadC [Paracoccaceae bacterium]|nr:DNA repair protein RadC [Paracoccaceae bacterium]MDG1738257.1 DNA repair protein RadC [Paracoccaceae bacterium]MDG2260468.1 DNA repair protein RadC [Paracoccaceae bacterium]
MTTHAKSEFSDQPQLQLLQEVATPVPLPTKSRLPSYISEHRKRLRDRFDLGGSDPMPDYELLELFLFHVLPRIDTKPIAHALLKGFDDLTGIVSAQPQDLTKVKGVGPAVARELKVLEAISQRVARTRVLKREVVGSWNAVIDYCRAAMANRTDEQFRVLFLDRKNCLIMDELLGQGTVDHVPVYHREIVKRALELSASALLLVHNHPSGDPTPSAEDIAMTQKISDACATLSITLHDHIIVGKNGESSFRTLGLLQD